MLWLSGTITVLMNCLLGIFKVCLQSSRWLHYSSKNKSNIMQSPLNTSLNSSSIILTPKSVSKLADSLPLSSPKTLNSKEEELSLFTIKEISFSFDTTDIYLLKDMKESICRKSVLDSHFKSKKYLLAHNKKLVGFSSRPKITCTYKEKLFTYDFKLFLSN